MKVGCLSTNLAGKRVARQLWLALGCSLESAAIQKGTKSFTYIGVNSRQKALAHCLVYGDYSYRSTASSIVWTGLSTVTSQL